MRYSERLRFQQGMLPPPRGVPNLVLSATSVQDLWDTINHLNDGHTLWVPVCYRAVYQIIIPAPIIGLEIDGLENIYMSVPKLIPVFASSLLPSLVRTASLIWWKPSAG